MSKVEDIELAEQLLSTDADATTETSSTQEPQVMPYEVTYKGHTITIDSLDWRVSKLLRAQIVLSFMLFAILGLADQAVGTLLPFLVKHYDTTETVISIVFMLQFTGYAVAALANDYLHVAFGRRGVLLFAAACLCVPFTIITLTEVLWLFIVVYFAYGLGVGLLDSCVNVNLSGVVDNNEILGFLHGFYGLGAVISPPVVSWVLAHWGYRFYYLVLSIISAATFVAVYFIFTHETKWKYEYMMTKDTDEFTEEKKSVFTLLKDKLILCFCGYLFFYIGAELSIGSWLLTYLRKIKDMEQLQASYVVSWFWIGLTCGRMLLGFVTKRFKNEYRANLWYSIVSWATFSLFMIFSLAYDGSHYDWMSKVFVFVMGVFIGPLFPTAQVTLMSLLPVQQQVTGAGIVNSLGGTGSAVLPFCAGVASRWMGFEYLLVFINFILLTYCIIWGIVPKFAGNAVYDF